jgi:hypothetical protein
MESTAQYWKPMWQALEGEFGLHLAQAHSNKAPKGRKRDFTDAERLVRRYIAVHRKGTFFAQLFNRLKPTIEAKGGCGS